MDPDTTLATALGLARDLADSTLADDAADLAGAVLALDEWLAKGGYLPARWAPATGGACGQPPGYRCRPDTQVPERRRDNVLGPDGQPVQP